MKEAGTRGRGGVSHEGVASMLRRYGGMCISLVKPRKEERHHQMQENHMIMAQEKDKNGLVPARNLSAEPGKYARKKGTPKPIQRRSSGRGEAEEPSVASS